MSAYQIIRSMRQRVPWQVAGKIFRREGLSRSQGWDRTLERVQEDEVGEFADSEEELSAALTEHIMAGEKLVRVFRLGEADLDTLREEALGLEPEGSPFSDQFPILLDADALAEIGNTQTRLASVAELDDGVCLTFASTRFLTTREVYNSNDIPELVVEELGQFDEIIGVRSTRYQAMDTLWIPTDGEHLELRLDFPFGMPIQKGLAALDSLEHEIRDRFTVDPFQDQANLFPTIQGLYDQNGEGIVIELAFMVAGSAQKLERTRRGRLCCRQEAYHLAGKAGLDDPIQPYLISVMWSRPIDDNVSVYPEVGLRGKSIMTGQDSPFLGEMIIRNCIDNSDFAYVMDRVLQQLAE